VFLNRQVKKVANCEQSNLERKAKTSLGFEHFSPQINATFKKVAS
jgi:hypothetical protein